MNEWVTPSSDLTVINTLGRRTTLRVSAIEQARIISAAIESARPERLQRVVEGTALFVSLNQRLAAIRRDLTAHAMLSGEWEG